MKNRIILDLKNNVIRNLIKMLLITSFFAVVLSSLLVNHIGEVFERYITENLHLYVSVISDINDEALWSGIDYDPKTNYEKTREYFDYIRSIDESLYIYNECTFNAPAITHIGVRDGKLISDYKYDITHRLYGSYDDVAANLRSLQETIPNERMQEFVESEMKYQKILRPIVVNESDFHDLREGYVHIFEGRSFTEEELKNGDYVCMINSRTMYVADENGEITAHYVHPGDKVNCSIICHTDDGPVVETFELTVVGLNRPVLDFIHYRDIYFPLALYEKMMDKMAEHGYEGFNFNTASGVAYFETKGLAQMKELINVIKDNSHGYDYYANTNIIADALSSCIAISENIKGISSVSFVMCLLFCIALIVLDVYYRKKEIGLLMSFGEERKTIVKQIIIEEVMLYAVATVLAFVLSRILSGMIVNYLLSNSTANDILVYGGHQVKAAAMNIDLVLSSLDYVIYAAYIVVLIVMNVIIVNNQIRKYSPKELLAGE
ncbi:MAG: ABC transporter permease [Erysipelotrichaceae bacterium]|nr:ABC transporter permease [Erysipelotrichaceae bacterium]